MNEGDTLIALMEEDLALLRASKLLDELPEKSAILKLRHRLREIEEMRAKAEEECQKINALIKRAEDESAAIQDKIDAEQKKVTSGEVSSSKELQGLTQELAALKRKKESIEHEQLELMEHAEMSRSRLLKIENAIEDGAHREEELIATFRKKGGELQTNIAHMTEKRTALLAALPNDIAERYEKTREVKHGIAVGVFNGSICSACRTQIPANQAQALSSGPTVTECPNCHRILVVRRENS